MRILTRNQYTIFLFIFLFTLVTLISCNKESSGPDSDPPTMPPEATMLIDFSAFSSNGAVQSFPSSLPDNNSTLTKNNWGWAALNVGIWSAITKITLVVPVAAFLASFNQDAEYQEDGRWLWSRTFRVLGVLHTSNLFAEIKSNKVLWEMYISRDGAYTDFLWYEGESNFEAKEGTWLLYNNPDQPTPLIEILWHRTDSEVADIKYLNIVPGAAENGSYIYYALTGDQTYDAAFDLYAKVNDNHTTVEWHRLSQNGRVKDAIHFQDDEWHYWDETLEDVESP